MRKHKLCSVFGPIDTHVWQKGGEFGTKRVCLTCGLLQYLRHDPLSEAHWVNDGVVDCPEKVAEIYRKEREESKLKYTNLAKARKDAETRPRKWQDVICTKETVEEDQE